MVDVVFSVDLAAKFSAMCSMDRDFHVHRESNSLNKTPTEWVGTICGQVYENLTSLESVVLLIEDLPHGVPFRTSVKDVLRLQGRIIQSIASGVEEFDLDLVFVQPQVWQMHFDGVYRGGTKGAQDAAASLGYAPPDLVHKDLHGAARTSARKVMTDHIDAFLMARWFTELLKTRGSLDEAVNSDRRIQKYDWSES